MLGIVTVHTELILPYDFRHRRTYQRCVASRNGRFHTTLEYACIAPHGSELIPQLAGPKERKFSKTRIGLRNLAKRIVAAKPDTIVIASPHNLRLVGKIAIVVAENSTGTLRTTPKRIVTLKAKCNVEMARELLKASTARGLPVVGANYGTFEGPTSDMPMDWGTLVPLWFVLKEMRLRTRIVIVAPSREIPLNQNLNFGTAIGRTLERRRNRFVFVASADQSHTHSKSGPYGFSRAASRFDQVVLQAIEKNEMGSLMGLDSDFIEDAKPDSLWQLAILSGILREVEMSPKLVSYDVPTYYGMICAGFEKIQ